MGAEFRAKGANVQLGPGLNVARLPQEGRNFEYISGEEAALGAALAGPVVQGIQSQGIIAVAKHYILNSQEYDRGSPNVGPILVGAPVSEVASERVRWEVYMRPFEAAVAAGVGSVMCSYNRLNGTAACGDHETLVADLKGRLNFSGWVMSDWAATHAGVAAAVGGLDQEMPIPEHFNLLAFERGLRQKRLTEQQLKDKAVRILTPMFAVGVMDEPESAWDVKKLKANVTTEASVASARKLSAASTVLLKNAGVLPLPSGAAANGLKVAVLGYAASDNTVVHAGGSGSVVPSFIAAPLDSVKAALGSGGSASKLDSSTAAWVTERRPWRTTATGVGVAEVATQAGTGGGAQPIWRIALVHAVLQL